MSNYGTAIDKKWQKTWEETELYKFNPDAEGEKLYVLEMFSYPSGSQLHAGHWFNYGPVDSWARLIAHVGKVNPKRAGRVKINGT